MMIKPSRSVALGALLGMFAGPATATTAGFPDWDDDAAWALQVNDERVRISTRPFPGSDFVAVKAEIKVRTSMAAFVRNIVEVDDYCDWVNHCMGTELLSSEGSEFVARLMVDIPWPVKDRDLVARTQIHEDADSGHVRVIQHDEAALPVDEKFVRVPELIFETRAVPLADGWLDVEMQSFTDPGGLVPAFAVNWLVDTMYKQSAYDLIERLESGVLDDAVAQSGR